MAMKPCRECGKEVSSAAKTCPQCGIARPVYTWGFRRTFYTVLFGGMVLTAIISAAISPSVDDPDEDRLWESSALCERMVRKSLKAPSTAKFPDEGRSTVRSSNERLEFTTVGSVDAQNGFGAQIRSKFRCVLEFDAVAHTWRAKEFAID
jgi:hypothetical protein